MAEWQMLSINPRLPHQRRRKRRRRERDTYKLHIKTALLITLIILIILRTRGIK